MLTLRLTTKAFKKFKQKPQIVEADTLDTNFGQWYVTTIDSVNKGNLFMAVMHVDSFYAMLIPIEKGMDLKEFTDIFFANLLLRIIRLEVPRQDAEHIISSYGGHAVITKTNSRSITAHLSTIIKEIDVIMEWPEEYVTDNTLDIVRLESRINDIPRGFKGLIRWPLEGFYKCIRQMCPKLPARKPLPFHFTAMGKPERIMRFFNGKVPDALAAKIEVSTIGAEVLFNLEEIHRLYKAVLQPSLHVSDGSVDLHSLLERMLRHQLKHLESQQ